MPPALAVHLRLRDAGGAALHFHTGARVSVDVDAVFSMRIALPGNLEVSYRDEDGVARLLYFDRQYNDTPGPLHEDAFDDSQPLRLGGIDAKVLDVRLLTPLDLAVSKLGSFPEQDRADTASLAQRGLITTAALEKRAREALARYIGDTQRLEGAITAVAGMMRRSRPAGRRGREAPFGPG